MCDAEQDAPNKIQSETEQPTPDRHYYFDCVVCYKIVQDQTV